MITKAAEAIIKTVQRESFKKEFDDIVQRTNNYEGRDGARARKRSQKKIESPTTTAWEYLEWVVVFVRPT